VVKKNPQSLELLNFQKSEILLTHIQILIYITQLSYKRKLHNPGASAINKVISIPET